MKKNIILCGVGGQGILTISKIIVIAAMKEGLQFKQAEVHGMSQRGGSVYAHLHLSDKKIFSPIIPIGEADLVLSMEPLEALRHAHFLAKKGSLVSASGKLPNIQYDELAVLAEIKRLKGALVDSRALAENAGSLLSENMVLLGASAGALGLKESNLEEAIKEAFSSKKEIAETNLKAFGLGLKG
ncbi:MAG: indolepyruvate oxidoreductase subunit beta [Candidatus Diapherotrites archaeon]|nr:indolepyruvate oxidoreductase subunit beta [Candidatus Diapherotrites archaeon]